MAVCATALLVMVLPAAGTGQAPVGGTIDAREGRRASLGLAGEGHHGSRHPAAALQPGQGAAPSGQADHLSGFILVRGVRELSRTGSLQDASLAASSPLPVASEPESSHALNLLLDHALGRPRASPGARKRS